LDDYYSQFKGIIDELNEYHPPTDNLETPLLQREELYVYKFLYGLHTTPQLLRGQLLTGQGGIQTLQNVFAPLLGRRELSYLHSHYEYLFYQDFSYIFTKGRGFPRQGYGGSRDRGIRRVSLFAALITRKSIILLIVAGSFMANQLGPPTLHLRICLITLGLRVFCHFHQLLGNFHWFYHSDGYRLLSHAGTMLY